MKIIQILLFTLFISILTSCDDVKSNANNSNMIIYSVTTKVDPSIQDEWLAWVDGHIEHILETDRFSKAIFSKVNGLDDTDGSSYNIQFWAYSAESLEAYRQKDAPAIKKGTLARFPEGLINSRSEFKVIKSFDH